MITDSLRVGEVAVIGLGRSGEAATRLLLAKRARVYASDTARSPSMETMANALRAAGADVHLGGHDHSRIVRASLVVVSPGIPSDAPAISAARRSWSEPMVRRQSPRSSVTSCAASGSRPKSPATLAAP